MRPGYWAVAFLLGFNKSTVLRKHSARLAVAHKCLEAALPCGPLRGDLRVVRSPAR